jgi:hypothetical protein
MYDRIRLIIQNLSIWYKHTKCTEYLLKNDPLNIIIKLFT